MKKTCFSIILFLGLASLHAVADAALQSATLVLEPVYSGKPDLQTAGPAEDRAFDIQDGMVWVAGWIAPATFRIKTTRHVTLLDEEGRNIPLWIERRSLAYESDWITGMQVAFRIPEGAFAPLRFRLVWSREPEPLAENRERQAFIFRHGLTEAVRGFRLEGAEGKTAASDATMLIEVDAKNGAYRFGYLFPILLVLALHAFRLWRRRVDHD